MATAIFAAGALMASVIVSFAIIPSAMPDMLAACQEQAGTGAWVGVQGPMPDQRGPPAGMPGFGMSLVMDGMMHAPRGEHPEMTPGMPMPDMGMATDDMMHAPHGEHPDMPMHDMHHHTEHYDPIPGHMEHQGAASVVTMSRSAPPGGIRRLQEVAVDFAAATLTTDCAEMVNIYSFIQLNIYIYICLCILMFFWSYIYTYIYIYIHTDTQCNALSRADFRRHHVHHRLRPDGENIYIYTYVCVCVRVSIHPSMCPYIYMYM